MTDSSIQMHTTRSSMISQYGYNQAEKQLTLVFTKGGTYIYKDVPKSVFDDLAEAESIGKYFLANIKDKYEFEKE